MGILQQALSGAANDGQYTVDVLDVNGTRFVVWYISIEIRYINSAVISLAGSALWVQRALN